MNPISPSYPDPTALQMETFKKLVEATNRIPGIHIDMSTDIDRQRDALAFVVDTIYRQFKDSEWQTALNDLPSKILEWNTPPDPLKASISLLSFIRHLYEYRILEIMNDSSISPGDKKKAQAVLRLYSKTIDTILNNPPKGKPVRLSGISPSLLPEWYHNKLYNKANI